jgi:hypothetical protein
MMKPIVGRSGIEQPRDIWMIQLGQDLALRSESAQNFRGVASAQDFDRNLFLKLTVRTFCQKHRAHSTMAKFTNNDIGSDALTYAQRFFLPKSGGGIFGTVFKGVGRFI